MPSLRPIPLRLPFSRCRELSWAVVLSSCGSRYVPSHAVHHVSLGARNRVPKKAAILVSHGALPVVCVNRFRARVWVQSGGLARAPKRGLGRDSAAYASRDPILGSKYGTVFLKSVLKVRPQRGPLLAHNVVHSGPAAESSSGSLWTQSSDPKDVADGVCKPSRARCRCSYGSVSS